ncbi:hypothetical protein PM082_015338 [Marasmius tenuissimus]|nr:hypothetical protein PM082_015338 [Marasmius tenuissimus]
MSSSRPSPTHIGKLVAQVRHNGRWTSGLDHRNEFPVVSGEGGFVGGKASPATAASPNLLPGDHQSHMIFLREHPDVFLLSTGAANERSNRSDSLPNCQS